MKINLQDNDKPLEELKETKENVKTDFQLKCLVFELKSSSIQRGASLLSTSPRFCQNKKSRKNFSKNAEGINASW